MNSIKIYLSLTLSLFAVLIFAQDKGVTQFLEQAFQARLKYDYSNNIKNLKQAEALLNESDSPEEQSKLLMELTKHYLVMNNFDSAKFYVDKLSVYSANNNLPLSKAYSLLNRATYFNYLDAGELAIENAQKGIEILKGDQQPALLARAYYILYGVYSGWDNLALCQKYAELAIQKSLQAEDYELLANSYSAKAYVSELKFGQDKNRLYLDSIHYFLQKSIDTYTQFPQEVSVRTYAIANINMANFYFQFQNPKKASTEAQIVYYAQQAKNVYEKFDNSYQIMANVNGLLAELALQKGNSDLAKSKLLDSYEHLIKAEIPAYYTLSNVAQGLSELFVKLGDFPNALFYQKKKEKFIEKIFDQAEMTQGNKLEALYENKRLLSDIEESKQKAFNRRIQLLLLGGVCVFLLIILFLLRYSFKNKHKLQLMIQKEKETSLLFEQKLLTIQMDQMQKESMADALQIERKNRFLLQLKEKLQDLETKDNIGFIDRMIRQEMRLEQKVSQSVKEFKNIHPEFFQKLKRQSNDRLSPLELKHCAYIHLKLSTKEIAAAFHIEPKSVRVSKYRIKQKLGLEKEIDLDRFLQELVGF